MDTQRIVYLNGEFLPIERAHISVLDRGFLFADGVYEVVPVYRGKPFRLAQHLMRLQASLDAVRIEFTVDTALWAQKLHTLLQRNGATGDHALYVEITRGVGATRDHAIPRAITPTLFAMVTPTKTLSHERLRQGKTAITLADTRWQNCYIKSTALLANILLYQQAKDAGADEAILLREGHAVEGASSNLFIVQGGVLITPPLSPLILGGITRDCLLELATNNNLPHREATITEHDLRNAEEIWITSSTREIFPIIKLDGVPVGNGKVGAVWETMYSLYQALKDAEGRHPV